MTAQALPIPSAAPGQPIAIGGTEGTAAVNGASPAADPSAWQAIFAGLEAPTNDISPQLTGADLLVDPDATPLVATEGELEFAGADLLSRLGTTAEGATVAKAPATAADQPAVPIIGAPTLQPNDGEPGLAAEITRLPATEAIGPRQTAATPLAASSLGAPATQGEATTTAQAALSQTTATSDAAVPVKAQADAGQKFVPTQTAQPAPTGVAAETQTVATKAEPVVQSTPNKAVGPVEAPTPAPQATGSAAVGTAELGAKTSPVATAPLGTTETGFIPLTTSTAGPTTTAISSPLTNAAPAPAQLALSPVHTQVADAIKIRGTDNAVTVRLDPPDLGSVTIDFTFDKSKMVLATVQADQPDTNALLRRNLDGLQRELAQAGFEGVRVDVSSDGSRSEQAGRENFQGIAALTEGPGSYSLTSADTTPARVHIISADRIDIRV